MLTELIKSCTSSYRYPILQQEKRHWRTPSYTEPKPRTLDMIIIKGKPRLRDPRKITDILTNFPWTPCYFRHELTRYWIFVSATSETDTCNCLHVDYVHANVHTCLPHVSPPTRRRRRTGSHPSPERGEWYWPTHRPTTDLSIDFGRSLPFQLLLTKINVVLLVYFR